MSRGTEKNSKNSNNRCSICLHEKRKEIDKAVIQPGATIRGTARQFAISDDALRRHVKNGHIEAKITKVQAAHDAVEADDLLHEIQEIEDTTKTIISSAMDRKIKTKKGEELPNPDHHTALKALDARGKQIELKGKILGDFQKDQPKNPNGPAVILSSISPSQIEEEVKRRVSGQGSD